MMREPGSAMMTARPWTQLQSWANLVLGIILFVSPWFLVTWEYANSAWNSWILGAVIALVALWALATLSKIPSWINLVLGAWVFISPWVLDYATMRESWVTWVIGILVFLISAWAIVQGRSSSMRATG